MKAQLILRPLREIAPLVRRPIETSPDQFYPEVGIRSFGRGVFTRSLRQDQNLEKSAYSNGKPTTFYLILFLHGKAPSPSPLKQRMGKLVRIVSSPVWST